MTPSPTAPLEVLTDAQLVAEPLSQVPALGQLLPEALAQVVVNVSAPEEVLEGAQGVPQVLGQAAALPTALPQHLPQVGELPSLGLDQGVVFPRRDGQAGCSQGSQTRWEHSRDEGPWCGDPGGQSLV